MNLKPLHLYFFMGQSMIRRMFLIMSLLLLALPPLLAQTVTSDKDDYAPGEIAIITGSGWINDEYVDVHFEEEPSHDHHHGYHDTKVNPDGTWQIEYPIEDRHLGVKFTVVVEGKQSGVKALTYFTDGNIQFTAGGLPNNTDVSVKVTYTPANPSGASEKTETIKFKSQSNGGVAALDGTKIYWEYLPSGTYVWDGASNYTQGYTVSGNLTGNSAIRGVYIICTPPSVSAHPTNKITTYGDDNPEFSVSASGDIESYRWQVSSNNGSSWMNIDGATTSSFIVANPTVAMNGNLYRVAISGCGTTVYSNAAILTVNKRPLTITVNPKTKVYGSNNPPLDGNVDGLLSGDEISVSYSTVANTTSDVGSFPIIATILDPENRLSNYSVSNTPSILSITPAAATITLGNLVGHTYDGQPKSASAATNPTNLTGLNLSYKPVGSNSDAYTSVAPVNAGSYDVKAVLENANYEATEVTGLLVINKANQAISWTNPQSIVYGTALSAIQLNATLTTGEGELTYSPAAGNILGAGSHTLTVKAAATTSYNAAEATVILQVEKATPTLTLTIGDSHTYDGTPKHIAGVELKGVLENENIGTATVAYSKDGASVTSPVDAGEYSVTASFAGNNNYLPRQATGTLTITPRPVTVAANALSKVYGEVDPTLTYSITVGSIVGSDSFSGSLEREAGENVRAYAIGKGTLSLGNNYSLSFEGAQFTINPKPVTARISAEDKVYDGSEQATASGYIAANELVGADQVNVTVRNAAFSDKNVGTAKTVTADVSITHGNYTLSNVTATTTASITAKSIVGTFTAQNKVYDGTTAATVAERALVGTIAGDDIQLTGGEARFADKNADTGKTVTLVGAVLTGNDKDNYTLTSIEQALADITKRPASVTPNAVTKVYGTLDPVYSATLEGFVAADEIIAGFLRPLGEWVGEYDIVATLFPEEALSNYTITYNKGYLKITPAELVVTAHNASRKYGDANPEFTGSVSGIVGDDEIEISYTSVATPESVVGSYAITPELSGGLLVNYTVLATDGVLTIEKATLSLQVNNQTRKYGEANPAFDGTLTGLKNSDPITPSYRTEADESTNVGEYAITGSLVDPNNKLGNYEVSKTDGILTILPASAQIHLSDLSTVYNGQAQGVTVATVPEGLAVNITYNSEAVAPTKAGSYSVVAAMANSNYTAPDATGTLVIAQKELTADLSNSGKVYDGTTAAPGTTVSLTGIVSGDEVTAQVSEAAFSNANAGARTVSATVTLQGADAANYVLKQVNAVTSTISRAPLTITAPSMSKYCGQADPLTGYACTVTGAVNQEQILTSYAIAGTEVIPASADAKLENYDLTLVKGALTINGLTLDASAASTPRSVNEDVVINISVKDGETAVGGVEVVLHIEGLQSKTAVSNASGIATFNFNRLPARVYSVQAVAGGSACAASQVVYLPIYDPDGGFVTGGGWINSPKDALAADLSATGKANFGFVAKYKKGKNEVDGNTEFQFQNGNINFKSSSHTAATLVISGSKATYKGKGFINGGGMEYDFMVVATDGDINGGGSYDKFRIKIWNGGDVVYDNARGAADNAELGDAARLGGGSIVIHENKSLNGGSGSKKLAAIVTPEQLSASFLNYPNPYTDKTTITFSVEKDEQFALEVYDVKGARVRKTEEGVAEAGKVYEFEFSANTLPEGVYFARLTTASGVKTIKMVLKK